MANLKNFWIFWELHNLVGKDKVQNVYFMVLLAEKGHFKDPYFVQLSQLSM